MASPSTSTLRSGTVSRLAGPGAREKSWRGACGACLLEWLKEIAAKPAAATLRRLPLRRTAEAAEIEELRRRRANDPDQKRDRNRQRHQRAGVGEHAQKGLWLSHPARSQWIVMCQI